MIKTWKGAVITTLLALIILSSGLFIAGLRVRFALVDPLIVYVEPSERTFTIDNNQDKDVTFQVSNKNSMFCSANCSYRFYDRSDNKIIDDGEFTLNKDGHLNKTFKLLPYGRGGGQKIYNFDVECSNVRSRLCSTRGVIKTRSSFITLNYELTGEEKKIKERLEKDIKNNLMLINNASKELQKAYYILNNTGGLIEKEQLYGEYAQLLEQSDYIEEKTNDVFKLWSSEEYMELDSVYSGKGDLVAKDFYKKSGELLREIEISIDRQNLIVDEYNLLKNYFFDLIGSYGEYVIYHSDERNLTEEVNSVYGAISDIYIKNFAGRYEFLDELEKDNKKVYDFVWEFNQSLNEEYEKANSEGIYLASIEYSKKCDLGDCENLSEDLCLDLNKIFNEYETETLGEGVKLVVSSESRGYYNKYCSNLTNLSSLPTKIGNLDEVEVLDTNNITTYDLIKSELAENLPICCVYGECNPCCTSDECKKNSSLFPVVLIHGHSPFKGVSPEPSIDIFNKMQYQLQEDGYMNAGTIRFDFKPEEYKGQEWGLANLPVVVKASYYYDYFYSLGKYIYITMKADNIDTYAIRLNDIILLAKYKTGRPKVNIIAHSMGGLVVRRYIQIFGEDSLDKVILIGTPNEGIEPNVERICNILGERRECEDMSKDGVFLKKLNNPLDEIKSVRFYTISGKGCRIGEKDGDGVVTLGSSTLDYAEKYFVDGSCMDFFKISLHNDLADIDKYPKVYEYIKKSLDIP
ncbi:MAG: alpha/beta fold hydrolase [Nanoarchaeota archaeon]|nr:alpha/beta fold hydrolase [Nanoarchaeota archaeon]